MPNYDYQCDHGHDPYEVRCRIAQREDPHPCPACGENGHQVLLGVPPLLTVIIPDYPGSKRLKAGYVHSHGDRGATKLQMGVGGMVRPTSSAPHPIAAGSMPEPVRYRKPSP